VNAAAVEDNNKKVKEGSGHGRNRSISDFVPEQLQNVRQRHVTFGEGDMANFEANEYHMQREQNLAVQRGLTVPLDAKSQRQLPSPPPSTSSVAESDEADDDRPLLEDGSAAEYLEIHCGLKNKRRKFRQLRQLGEGTFSKVMLATRERLPSQVTPEIEDHLDPHKLVAVKIVEHGPAGGADEERIETSLKREVEMLKSISHPSLVHLKACEYQETRALLVLTYCPGGDLFELASQKRELLKPALIHRIFSELVYAVRYLHCNWIVHRDIKLENVLVNVSHHTLENLEDPLVHPTPLVTLTDLGLSRRIPKPPQSCLLQTRCGSEDYAAPEILLGQPYDGRQTDGWALGVVLYALMEGRLPFDAPPGKPDRSRNTHRIARCDWIWCRFGDEDGDWDPSRGEEFDGAQICVEGLLKKVRMGRKPLEDIENTEWVRNGIQVPGGLQMREEDEDELL
jgi:protein-serine/threonine kinase